MIELIAVADVLTMLSNDAREDYDDLYDVADVLPDKRKDPEYPALLESVRERGITVPILIRDGWVEDGHHRIAAAVDAGLEVVPCTDVPLKTHCEGCGR